MKISDKALKLIGRIILGDLDREEVATPRFSLDPQAAVKTAKAPILPFPKKDDEA